MTSGEARKILLNLIEEAKRKDKLHEPYFVDYSDFGEALEIILLGRVEKSEKQVLRYS